MEGQIRLGYLSLQINSLAHWRSLRYLLPWFERSRTLIYHSRHIGSLFSILIGVIILSFTPTKRKVSVMSPTNQRQGWPQDTANRRKFERAATAVCAILKPPKGLQHVSGEQFHPPFPSPLPPQSNFGAQHFARPPPLAAHQNGAHPQRPYSWLDFSGHRSQSTQCMRRDPLPHTTRGRSRNH